MINITEIKSYENYTIYRPYPSKKWVYVSWAQLDNLSRVFKQLYYIGKNNVKFMGNDEDWEKIEEFTKSK